MILIKRIASRTALSAIALLVVANVPARAQYVCTTTPTDITCTNSGTAGSEFNQANGAGQSGTTINSGTSGNMFTQVNGNGNATTTNSGTVTVGIFTQDNGNGNATTTNSGTISSGVLTQANGIGNATTTNSGTINGGIITQANAVGNSTTTNSGTVNTGSITTQAVIGNATTVNSGTVNASIGAFTSVGSATTVNSGTVIGGGISTGANAGGTSTVINSGTVRNFGGIAIQLYGAGPDTLTLLPGSFIVGSIILAGTNDIVNVRAGNQNLTFNSLAGVTVTGTVPFAVSGNRIASVDPTSFATAGTVLSDFSRSVSAMVPDFGGMGAPNGGGASAFAAPDSASRMEDAFASIPGLSAYAADQIAFKNPTAIYNDGIAVWGRAFGGQHIQSADGPLARNVSTWYGGAIGVDKLVRPDLRLGVFVGGGTTHNAIDPNNTTDKNDSNLGFGGAYARYMVGASFLNAAIQGGTLHNSTSRLINNNLLTNGLETATASYNGWYISPELTAGHRFALGRLADSQYALTPSLQVRYLYAGFDGYTETGTTAPLTASSRNTQNVEERAELKLTRTTQIAPTSQLLFNLNGGAIGVQRVGGDAINATLLAQPIAFTTPGASNVWGGFGGLGVEWQMRNVSVFAAGEYIAWQHSGSIVSGRGGIRIGF